MRIDVSGIEKADGASLFFELEEEMKCLKDIREDCRFLRPVSFRGVVTNNRGILRLEGKLKTGYETVCSRCVKPLERVVDIDIQEEIINPDRMETIDEGSVYTFSGGYLNADRMLLDNIILSLPMKDVCSPDCKGLCPECGKDLNEGICQCRREDIDIRLEVLKDFFK